MNFNPVITEREKRVLKKLCEEKTAKEIGSELGINARTVEGIKTDLILKTGCISMVGLVKYSIKHEIYQL
jgi:DNA-binding CsgD family transcriptional regulator